jgi:hypothetical protein
MVTRPDFLGLEAFVAVAERGNFHAAAAHLGVTQTALSHRMRKLAPRKGTDRGSPAHLCGPERGSRRSSGAAGNRLPSDPCH